MRGLLLVKACKVFADTSDDVDEVMSPRFLYLFKETIILQ